MLIPEQTQWIADLRSDEFKQAQGVLECKDGFCCLGVASKRFAEGEREEQEDAE